MTRAMYRTVTHGADGSLRSRRWRWHVCALTVAEAERLINACDPEFRALVRAGLETGCRYGELIRLEVCDFNPDANTLAIQQSKSGKPRHVVLTAEGAAFFQRHCAGRSGHELMFHHGDGDVWRKSEQSRRMAEACA